MNPTICDVYAALHNEYHYGFVESINGGLVLLTGTGEEKLTITHAAIESGNAFSNDPGFHFYTRDEIIAKIEKDGPIDPQLRKVIVGAFDGAAFESLLKVKDTMTNLSAVIVVRDKFRFG
jgi:hypothetical protein